jgi:hypothetical protein
MGMYNPQMGTIPKCRVQQNDALHKEKKPWSDLSIDLLFFFRRKMNVC